MISVKIVDNDLIVKNFMLVAGSYGGRKVLSRAFRNRFIELHYEDLPLPEIRKIIEERCHLPPSYSKKIIATMEKLQVCNYPDTVCIPDIQLQVTCCLVACSLVTFCLVSGNMFPGNMFPGNILPRNILLGKW